MADGRDGDGKDGRGSGNKLIGAAQVALGVGFFLQGVYRLRNGQPVFALGRAPRQLPAGSVVKHARIEKVANIDERVARIKQLAVKGSVDPMIREEALSILTRKCAEKWCVAEKDYMGEVSALFWALRDPRSPTALRYTRDHVVIDQFHSAPVLRRLNAGDCFVKGTLVLRDDHRLVPVEALRAGDRIWGLDRWSTVTNTWDKGVLPTWTIRLNNGSSMRLTPGHKVWVLRCPAHSTEANCAPSKCASGYVRERIYVRDLKPRMMLTRPERVPCGTGDQDPRRALIEGFYLSDGWHSRPSAFEISGKDGCPKELQKREVEEICKELGIRTYWHRKYISVKDPEWTARVRQMGRHAPDKQALSINLAEGGAANLLRGILADSGANTLGRGRTFTTTSRALFVQTRVLAKMFGITCGERYVVDHGGLGKNPIWRLQLWGARSDGKSEKVLRVREVVRDNAELPCFDFETDDHFVWLPEADWTTSQCDDGTIRLAAWLMSVGYPVKERVIQAKGEPSWSHIYLVTGIPPMRPSRWVALDWSVTTATPGWEAPGAKETLQTGRPHGVVARVKDVEITAADFRGLEGTEHSRE